MAEGGRSATFKAERERFDRRRSQFDPKRILRGIKVFGSADGNLYVLE